MNIIEKLNWRYATKQFSDKKLSDKVLHTIIESARLTASSLGLQSYHVIDVRNSSLRAQLQEASYGQTQVTEASHYLVLASATKADSGTADSYINLVAETRGITSEHLSDYNSMIKGSIGRMSDVEMENWLAKQVYIALGTMMTTCAILSVDSCPMEGFDKEAYDRILGLKDKGLTTVVALPIGYRADSDKHQHNIKVRRSFDDFVFTLE